MPIGNGDVTSSVWVDEVTGDLRLLVSKSDVFDENSQPVKVSRAPWARSLFRLACTVPGLFYFLLNSAVFSYCGLFFQDILCPVAIDAASGCMRVIVFVDDFLCMTFVLCPCVHAQRTC
jgi:hypothetical protein